MIVLYKLDPKAIATVPDQSERVVELIFISYLLVSVRM